MFRRINIIKIVIAHYKSLRNINRKGISYNDLILFFIFPLLISIPCLYYNISIKSQISNLATTLSILAGFLFNLLAIIHNSLGKIKKKLHENLQEQNMLKLTFANEIHSNISYNILVAIFLLVLIFILGLEFSHEEFQFSHNFINFISIFFLIHFVLTLLMILNRIYVLLDKEDE